MEVNGRTINNCHMDVACACVHAQAWMRVFVSVSLTVCESFAVINILITRRPLTFPVGAHSELRRKKSNNERMSNNACECVCACSKSCKQENHISSRL